MARRRLRAADRELPTTSGAQYGAKPSHIAVPLSVAIKGTVDGLCPRRIDLTQACSVRHHEAAGCDAPSRGRTDLPAAGEHHSA